ncbi:membrane protein [Planobispora rosea]|uniref:Membrane protein n=1 Tax=Planobispora rosea TaxID=35762 RepID=A0A8J3WBG1_PLARO|nr:anthrone oxygenase family protein [Planobispora rosea]GGS52824.1 membrane protein [Planobispora rosea]GIH83105.1 membrane protein [Planobispora rosea]
MLELFQTVTLVAATVATGLAAGLFYAFSVSVMLGLAETDDRTFIGVMQRINRRILNGWFALSFGGAPLLTLLAGVLHLLGGGERSAPAWIAAGFVLYGVTFVVTAAVNVPLNNAIDAAGDPAAVADPAAVRAAFETRWVRWNVVRTLSSTAALACLAWALVLHGGAAG